MKKRTLLILLVLLALGAFTTLNWTAFMAPTTLSLGVADVQAPLGLVMLAFMTVLITVFLIYVVTLQTTVLLDTRRHNQEQQSNRALADKAEASRFTELRAYMEVEMKKQAALDAESLAAVITRVNRLDQDFHQALEQSSNSLAAYIGELENRLENGPHELRPEPASTASTASFAIRNDI
ncbi:MAG: putative membrane protein [Rhodoferax sp.]|jgi:uncharacterized membrane protein